MSFRSGFRAARRAGVRTSPINYGSRGGITHVNSKGHTVYGEAPVSTIANRLMKIARKNPMGFSWRHDTGKAGTGVMVAEHPKHGHGAVIPISAVGNKRQLKAMISDWVKKTVAHVRADPEMHFGGWIGTDPSTGKRNLYLDMSRRYPKSQEKEAVEAGVRNNQIAVWSLDRHQEIATGGTGT